MEHAKKGADAADYSAEEIQTVVSNIRGSDDVILKLERAVLGAMMRHGDAFIGTACDAIAAEVFTRKTHAILFSVIREMWERGESVDALSVASRSLGQPINIAIVPAIEKHAADIPVAQQYIQELLRESVARDATKLGRTLVQDLTGNNVDVFSVVANARAQFDAVTDRLATSRPYASLNDIADETSEYLSAAIDARQTGKRVGIMTGFSDFDKRIGAYMPSEFVVVAARPSMGKTALAMNMTLNMAANGHKVGWFSLEMSAVQLLMRALSSESGAPLPEMRIGNISAETFHEINVALDKFRRLPVYMDDDGSHTIQRLVARAKTMIRRENVEIVFVDYMGLVDNPSESAERELAGISKALKRLAKETGCVVVALSQLSRAVESRADKRPMLSDLRQSGAIEQDADYVHFIYRPEYYGLTVDDDGNSTANVAEVITAKYRNGPTGIDRLFFDPVRVRFGNLSERGLYAERNSPF